ncbi:MAG: M20/M25/M40 family metallo-hydrolase, partial [Spirochaetales bacterium]|nr:M20/M25/M40 family metallo-hydrolase [Spirochaetales bacterium]
MDDRWVRRCTRLLRDLIAIPSVNPADRTAYDREIYGERGVTDYMARYFAAFDYDLRIRTVPVLPERENVIVEAGGDEDEATLLLETHADTVEGAGMDTPPFQPVSKGDLLFGRGACDAKGQLAAMTIGLEMALAETNGDLPTPVRLALVVDEEHLHRGVDRLIEEGSCRGTRAIVGEPTGLRLSSALKGCIRFKIATLGVSAHTSIPHAGSNAIYLMSKVVRTIEEKVAPAVAEKRHDLCGQATISVSVIRGGRQVNIVPDHCEIDVDRRLNPGEEWEGAYRDIIDRITSALSGSERDRVRFVDPYLIDPAMETDTT